MSALYVVRQPVGRTSVQDIADLMVHGRVRPTTARGWHRTSASRLPSPIGIVWKHDLTDSDFGIHMRLYHSEAAVKHFDETRLQCVLFTE